MSVAAWSKLSSMCWLWKCTVRCDPSGPGYHPMFLLFCGAELHCGTIH